VRESSQDLNAKLLFETVHTSTGIYQFLFARKKGMTLRTYFYTDIFPGRRGLYDFTTRTTDRCRFVLGMDAFFHWIHSSIVVTQQLCYDTTFISQLQSFFSFFFMEQARF
jgi:hypothetical protein